MKRKVIWAMIIASIFIVSIGYFAMVYQEKEIKEKVRMVTVDSPYDNSEQTKVANKKLREGIIESKLISDDKTEEKYIGLSFQGLSDSATDQRITALLKKYNRRATFFVPAIQAVECKEVIDEILKNGNTIGSNGLSGKAHMEELSEDEIINDLTAANCVITSLTGDKSPMLQCRATQYDEALLKLTNACGNEKVIFSPHMINYQSFYSYEQVHHYIEKLNRGAILTIRLEGILDNVEVMQQEVDAKPAIDMQPTISQEEKNFFDLSEEDRIVEIVEWILMALDETNYQTKDISEFQTEYEKSAKIDFGETEKKTETEEPIVYCNIPMERKYTGLQVRGISDEKVLQEFLDELKKNKQNATFYLTLQEMEKYPDRVQKVLDAGCSVQSGGETDELLTDKSVEEIRNCMQKCKQFLLETYGITSAFFMPADGRYDENVCKAAKEEGFILTTYNKKPELRKENSETELLETFRNKLSAGSLIYFNLDNRETEEIFSGILQMIQDKSFQTATIEKMYANKGSVEEVKMAGIPLILTQKKMNQLKKKKGEEAIPQNMVYTTERAVAFSFSGIQNESATDQVLKTMEEMGAKGTFFVSYQDIQKCRKTMDKIVKQGHELGISMIANNKTTFLSTCNEISMDKKLLKQRYSIDTNLIMLPYSRTNNENVQSEMKKAIKTMECVLVGNSISVVQTDLKNLQAASEYYQALTQSKFHIQRGQIIYTRLDYLEHSEILGEVLLRFKQDKIDPIGYYDEQYQCSMWQYEIKPVSDVLLNRMDGGAKLYHLNAADTASSIINVAKIPPLENEQFMKVLQGRYIGNPDVDGAENLPGFQEKEIPLLDLKGKVPGDLSDKLVFLTFDDWGTDQALNHLLYVLHKYQIKATFFVRSNYVLSNPNMLREIALEGHEIGSHTSSHLRLSNEVPADNSKHSINRELTVEEANALRLDVVRSYQELYRVVGDVNVNGHKSLVPIFRPPTLSVSKLGLRQIFETGYEYCISGDYSTQDYKYRKENGGVNELTKLLCEGYPYWDGVRKIESHSIVVMHMSDDAECSAQAIANWMEWGARSKFHFTVPIYQYLTR